MAAELRNAPEPGRVRRRLQHVTPGGAAPAVGGRKMGPRFRGDDEYFGADVAFCAMKSEETQASDQTGSPRPLVLGAEHGDRRLGRVRVGRNTVREEIF